MAKWPQLYKSQFVEECLARRDGAFTGGKARNNFPKNASPEESEPAQEEEATPEKWKLSETAVAVRKKLPLESGKSWKQP